MPEALDRFLLCSGTLSEDSWHPGSAEPSVNPYPRPTSRASVDCGSSDWPASTVFMEAGIIGVTSPGVSAIPNCLPLMALDSNALDFTWLSVSAACFGGGR